MSVMEELFYIVEVACEYHSWYNLRVRGTHFCVSSGDSVEDLLKVVDSYVRTYRTSERLLKRLSKTDGGGVVCRSEYKRCEGLLRAGKDLYGDLIAETVEKAYAGVREERKRNNPFKKTQKLLGKVTTKPQLDKGITVILEPKKTKKERGEGVIIKKPRVFR